MRLLLIRHGLTDYNLKNRYCGFRDIGLNKLGKTQVRAIKNKLKGLKIDKVFCSDLKRSKQTARIIFGDSKCKIIENLNFREINFGRWEGLTYKQILKEYPVIYKRWLKAPFSRDIPGGEKMDNFISRIKNELKKIIKNNPGRTVALVTHLGPIRVILNTILKSKKSDFWRLKINPKAIYMIEYSSQLRHKVYEI